MMRKHYELDPALKLEDEATARTIEGKVARLREILMNAEARFHRLEDLETKYMNIGGDAYLQFQSFYKAATKNYDEVGEQYTDVIKEKEAHQKWCMIDRGERLSLLNDVLLNDGLSLILSGMKGGLQQLGNELSMSATRKIDSDLLNDIDGLMNEFTAENEEVRKRILEQPYILYYAMSLPKANG